MKFKNYLNKYNNEPKIYSKDDILNMSVKEAFDTEQPIVSQYKQIGIPTVDELSASSNVVWVDAYTRDDGTEVRGHWRSKPDSGAITSGAVEVKEGVNQGVKKEVPQMTLASKGLEMIGKILPTWALNDRPERQYYKLALGLKNIRKTGNVPEWFSEHNELLKVSDIHNIGLKNSIENILSNENMTTEQMNDVDVVVTKSNSDIVKFLERSPELKNYIEKRAVAIKDGKYKKVLCKDLKFELLSNKLENPEQYGLSHTIHRGSVYDMKLENDNTISMIIVDYYDFAPKGGRLNHNAYIQQENNKLQNYMLIVPLRIRYPEIKSAK